MPERDVRGGRVRALLRLLLRIYPASFRDAMGDDLVSTLDARHRDAARRRSLAGVLRFWLLEGRRFPDDVRAQDPLAIIINQAAARAVFPNVSNPVGRRLRFGRSNAPMREIIGVVADVSQRGPGQGTEAQRARHRAAS